MENERNSIDDELMPHDPGKIPTFLKVLCILTFVGAGFGIISGLSGLVGSAAQEEGLRMMQNMPNDLPDDFGVFQGMMEGILDFDIEEMIKWTFYMNIANLIGAAMCLTGALIMWKLKKSGYFIYVIGCIIPTVIGFIGMRHMFSGGFFGKFAQMGVVFTALFSVAFIIMYGVNLKHMRSR
ncbi:MAG: hypothetical protein QNK23_02375 [Crocinitomicaceae bacterium]|nr:hypothetical protein [Crocinitomicaceae bacterium]